MPAETGRGSNYPQETFNPWGITGFVFLGKFPVKSRYWSTRLEGVSMDCCSDWMGWVSLKTHAELDSLVNFMRNTGPIFRRFWGRRRNENDFERIL